MNRAKTALTVCASAAILAACAGENLFSLAASVGEPGPEVEITAPTSGLEKAIGDSILVQASVNAPSGASSVVYSGIYSVSGDPAYTSEDQNLSGLVTVSLSNYLRASPTQVTGTALVIVSVTDQAGETAADSVTVNVVAAIAN